MTTIIAPSGNNFDFNWSPVEKTNIKTASSNKNEKDDKTRLYEIAKNVVAQTEEIEEINEIETPEEISEEVSEEIENLEEENNSVEEISEEIENLEEENNSVEKNSDTEVEVDVQEAVSNLVDKVEKAEGIAEKVETAIEKVEDALEDVKEAIGSEAEEISETIEDLEKEEAIEDDLSEIEETNIENIEDIEDEEVLAKSASNDTDGFVKLAKISPKTRNKVYTYWTKYLGYPKDYAKLMVTNFEK